MTLPVRFSAPLLLAKLLAAIACNGAKQTPTTTPDEGATPQPGRVADGKESYDISPVAEPGPLLAHARWKNPGANIQTLGRLMRLPPAAANALAKTIVEGAVEELLGERADAKAFAELVALDAPMDV